MKILVGDGSDAAVLMRPVGKSKEANVFAAKSGATGRMSIVRSQDILSEGEELALLEAHDG